MYSKQALLNTSKTVKRQENENDQKFSNDDDSSDNESFEDDLSDIEKKRHF
jgi:hypothetical protein